MSELANNKNMLNNQLRVCDINNKNLLSAIKSTKRSIFVPEKFKNSAYIDSPIPLPENQEMFPILISAKILQELDIQKNNDILIIGSGSGYLCALASKLAKQVDAVEYHPSLTKLAQENIKKAKIKNVNITTEDGACGIKSTKTYDHIIITPAIPKLIERYLENLKIGGKIIYIQGTTQKIMPVKMLKKLEHKKYIRSILFETISKRIIEKQPLKTFDF